MKKNTVKLTTAQFARLHNVNKRTLHYYDSIGLFSPSSKGENGYRYYDLSQSIDFESILMLKELNMSIEEIEDYLSNPASDKFITLSTTKEQEIDREIKRLKNIRKAIQIKREQIELCKTLDDFKIELTECKEEKLLVLPYDFYDNDVSNVFYYMKETWDVEQIRMGVGGIISVEKVLKNDFSIYDGLYTPALSQTPAKNIFRKPAGTYICCYHRGTWSTLPLAYQKIVSFAKKNSLRLTGFAYEIGLNEFAISDEKDYITKIMIKTAKLS